MRTGRLFVKMILTLTLFTAVLLIALTFLLLENFKGHSERVIEESNAKLLSQVSYSANYMNDTVKSFAFYLFNQKSIQQWLYTSDYAATAVDEDDYRRLYDYIRVNPFVHSLYLYNSKLNLMLSVADPSLAQSGYVQRDFYDQDILKRIRNVNQSERFKPIPRAVPLYNDKVHNVYTYIIYDYYSKTEGIQGAIVVNIRSDYLQQIIANMSARSHIGETLILDREGRIINFSSRFAFNESLKGHSFADRILRNVRDNGGEPGSFIGTLDGKRVLISYTHSEDLGWTFINYTDYSVFASSINRMKWITFVICFVMLAVSLVLVYVISRRLYLPIGDLVHRLVEKTGAADKAQGSIDETGIITDLFQEVYDKAKHADHMSRNMKSIEKLKFIQLLLADSQSLSNPSAAAEHHHLKIDLHSPMRLIGLSIDRYETISSKFDYKDRQLLLYAVSNVAGELLAARFPVETAEVSDGSVVALLNVGGAADSTGEGLAAVVEEIKLWSRKNLHLSLTAVIGRVCGDVQDLSTCWQELRGWSKYRLLYGHGSTITEDLIANRDASPYELPKSDISDMLERLANGKHQEAKAEYRRIIGLLADKPYDTVVSNLIYVSYMVFSFLNNVASNSMYQVRLDLNTFVKGISNAETMDEIHAMFEGLFDQVQEKIEDWKRNRSHAITGTMASIIETEYADKGLNLDCIAERLNMSKVYVGKMFRDAYGKSVAEYITEVRINRTIELLKNGSKNLNAILDEVGIENRNYFYKLFKAKVGVTLSDYRMKHFSSINAGGGAETSGGS